MADFRDAQERSWVLKLDAPSIRAVRDSCGVDLIDLESQAFLSLADDPVLLVDVLWTLCRDQAASQGVTERQFGESLVGDPIQGATEALLKSILDFFPARKRSLLTSLVEESEAIRAQSEQMALDQIRDPRLRKRLADAMEKRIGGELEKILTEFDSATNSQESAE